MYLKSISYTEFPNEKREWELKKSSLGKIALIVGKNSSGKTRILNVISGLADMISGDGAALSSGNYDVLFHSGDDIYELHLTMENQIITSEKLRLNKKLLLTRNRSGKGSIYTKEVDQDLEFLVPTDRLATVVRRDSVQHEFLEPLHGWAEGYVHYRFADDEEKNTLIAFSRKALNKRYKYHAVALIKNGIEQYGDKFLSNVMLDLKSLGYFPEDIGVTQPYDVIVAEGQAVHGLYVKEEDLECNTEQRQMSSGFFRALSVLLKINYLLLDKEMERPVLSIDDIGEGLDYRRSADIVKLLISKAKQSEMQLIMSTNDQFIMNGVPLEYWSIVNRSSKIVNLINIHTNPAIFEKYKSVGLNNFEFFASDFFLG